MRGRRRGNRAQGMGRIRNKDAKEREVITLSSLKLWEEKNHSQ